MWNDQQRELRPLLDPDERLLWAGQPRQGFVIKASDAYTIPFSLLWGGFAIFWETSVIKSGAPFFFMLWGIPFVLAGLYFIFGRFVVDMKQRRRTLYGVTDRRVVIVSGLFNQSVKSLNLRTLADVSLDLRGDGSGTITFGPSDPRQWWMKTGVGIPARGQQAVPEFEMIQEARKVYDIIRTAQQQALLKA
ncbi:MAG TPA: PH domain-containing protein [Pyrinomonadaceae bacterium]|nr:PH domain-containing protein [Pyrinomonadaceae bacterium]